MSNKGQLLQDPFLNALRREHVPVSIYLVNGIKLQGQVRRAAAQHRDPDGLQARHLYRRSGSPREYPAGTERGSKLTSLINWPVCGHCKSGGGCV